MTRTTRKQIWIEQVADFRASGQSRAAFCRARGFSLGSLKNWERYVDARKPVVESNHPSRFVAVSQASSSASSRPSMETVRVRLPMGIEIESAAMPQPEWIAEVLLRLRKAVAS